MSVIEKEKLKIQLENRNLLNCNDVEHLNKQIENVNEDFNNHTKKSDDNSLKESYIILKSLKPLKSKLNALIETNDEIVLTLKLLEISINNSVSEECI